MSYTKKTWQNGEVITATALNNMEDGIKNNESAAAAASVLIVPITVTQSGEEISASTDMPFSVLQAAVAAGRFLIAKAQLPNGPAVYAGLTAVDNTENATSVSFSVVVDFSGDDEPTETSLLQVDVSQMGVRLKSIPLAT